MNHSNQLPSVLKINDLHQPHTHPPPHLHQYAPVPSDNSGYAENSFGERFWPANRPQHTWHDDSMDRIGMTGGGESSPALSALGLLAFLFFLNMIQNSLMTSNILSMRLRNRNITRSSRRRRTTRRPATMGAGGRDLHDDDDDDETMIGINLDFTTSDESNSGISLPENTSSSENSNPYANFVTLDKNEEDLTNDQMSRRNEDGDEGGEEVLTQESQIESPVPGRTSVKKRKRFRRDLPRHGMSVKCLQLFTCKLGRRLHAGLGTIISGLMRSFVIPKSRRYFGQSLTRALVNGWGTRKDCRNLYKECRCLSACVT